MIVPAMREERAIYQHTNNATPREGEVELKLNKSKSKNKNKHTQDRNKNRMRPRMKLLTEKGATTTIK